MARNPQARTGLDTMLGAAGNGTLAGAQGNDTAAGADALIAAGTAPTAAAQASAAGGDTIVATDGLAGAASALGLDPNVRVRDVDPGVGAHRRAFEGAGIADVSTEPVRSGSLSDAERSELEALRRRVGDTEARMREQMNALVPGSAVVDAADRLAQASRLDASAPRDAAGQTAIPSSMDLRVATAATQILRSGRIYRPEDSIPLTFEEYAELREIGAIVATPWGRLPPADEV